MTVTRRTLLLATLGSIALAGCGFALRRPAELPFSKLAISGFKPNSPMAQALRQSLPRSVTVVAQPKDADVVLLAIEDRFDKTVAASTAAGQVREFRLRVTLRFRLDRPDGSPQLPETQLELTRDMSYDETAALAKQVEEAGLVREMRMDLAQQLLQMLAATGRPVSQATAPAAG
ncbi:MAG TPA: LPS assembly lipoprotein LptE [Ideonella sp.]|uniref:LPS-assembly lipoprotein LptE n=1 Tax=Ideonella sp. TaxID=1929293 RepID=UPI002E2F5F48|nr:LPS assembly lipoprotein LptE [Ideonella sp.]HEX5686035.1 LPS assembly lipoprotein LptE [Ideonella sp.]